MAYCRANANANFDRLIGVLLVSYWCLIGNVAIVWLIVEQMLWNVNKIN